MVEEVIQYPKAEPGKRIVAYIIDCVLSSLVSFIPVAGWIVVILYCLFRDGLFDGQSIGKKIMNLKVINLATGSKCDWATSAYRNFLFLIPIVNFVHAIAALVFIISEPKGHHWGDKIAKTQVIPV